MKYLLDTNVVSEPTKLRPHPAVMAFLRATPAAESALSVVTYGEVEFGIRRLPASAQRRTLQAWWDASQFQVLDIDTAVASTWAQMRVEAARTLSALDSLIAATALAHGLTLVTRNEADFRGVGVSVLDPWSG